MNEKKSIVKPTLIALAHFFVFVILIVGVITFLRNSFPQLEEVFNGTVLSVVILGSFVALTAGMTAYFMKGTKARMSSGVLKAATLIIYNLGIYQSLDMKIERDDVILGIDYPGIRVLLILLLILYGAYFVFEYIFYRDEVKDDEGKIDEDPDLDPDPKTEEVIRSEPKEELRKDQKVREDKSHWK